MLFIKCCVNYHQYNNIGFKAPLFSIATVVECQDELRWLQYVIIYSWALTSIGTIIYDMCVHIFLVYCPIEFTGSTAPFELILCTCIYIYTYILFITGWPEVSSICCFLYSFLILLEFNDSWLFPQTIINYS